MDAKRDEISFQNRAAVGEHMGLMRWDKGIRVLAACLGLALVLFWLQGHSLFDLLKFIGLGVGVSLLIVVIYPSVRGIKRGDRVMVLGSSGIAFLDLFSKVGMAMNDAKRGDHIRVRLDNGREVVGVVEEYESLFSLPKVRVLYEERAMESK